MDANTKNIVFRTFLLVIIAGLLASITVKLHFGKNIANAFESSSEGAKQVESPKSEPNKQTGRFPAEELSGFSVDPNQFAVTTKQSQDVTQILQDSSRVSRMEDGFGNSTVKRTFRGHKLLRMVMIRNHKNRQQKIFVYAKSGQVKLLPEEYADRVLSAPASEIASAAKIYDSENVNQKRKQRISLVRDRQRSKAEEKRRSAEVYEAPIETADTEPVREVSNESEPDTGDQEDG